MAACLLYFISETGEWQKAIKPYDPYFYVQCDEKVIQDVQYVLSKQFTETLKSIDIVSKEDLQLVNHLSGKLNKFIKLTFKNVQDLMIVKRDVQKIVNDNKKAKKNNEVYDLNEQHSWMGGMTVDNQKNSSDKSTLAQILEIREYDVAYHIRTMIDEEIRCSGWYEVTVDGPMLKELKFLPDKLDKADLRVMAFDIETTKAELRFPDSRFDQIMMISYIVDGAGFLITNREIVGDDVDDFEYAPLPEYDVGQFTVFNEQNEKALLQKFFEHIRETKPFIFVTFNGDFFDFPFIQDRAETYNMKMEEEIGIYNGTLGEILGRFAPHLDCLYWVKRDAYLPQGSHGLKAVTKAKLGYDPVELDPELMVPYAKERPQQLAEYSVSDSVATYFLYKKMIHDFIFALCTIIPTFPDEVLRRGSGTLCENLLMAQAFRGNIVFPNKQVSEFERFNDNKLIDSDTYTGGTVECLQQGVFRSDFPVNFKLKEEGYQRLIEETEEIMKFAIEIECKTPLEDVTNFDEIKTKIIDQLGTLKTQCPHIESEPLIYHVDVAAMYPNIILSNRLQPVAIVNEEICAGCVFNAESEKHKCKRHLDWQWKGEMFPLTRGEVNLIKNQLLDELAKKQDNKKTKESDKEQQQNFNDKLRQRIKNYCQKVYKQIHVNKIEQRSDTVCMRENPFYVDTVRDFRDRRYEFKRLTKQWAGKFKKATDPEEAETAKNRMNLYESLQLAHKIILNSFYGYVMKKGARWYSMEMAAMVTHTGGCIITESRQLFDQIGMPLELDTDGIWTLLPKGFPEDFKFTTKQGKEIGFDYPCTMCNNLIYEKYGNDQYQTKRQGTQFTYDIRNEMSVFFEIDGPYKCMLIPAAKEEGKMLKKRYAVFNHAGKMTEVKGFELKRRGELKIIKIFQEEVFSKFLQGNTLQECYDYCGEVGRRWYDILEQEGGGLEDEELIEYIGEERVIQKSLSECGDRKGTSITCAKRMAQFLGQDTLRDDGGGINVKFIISKKPIDAKVADRAIPTAIFQEKPQIKEKYLKMWCKDSNMKNFELPSILDWDYYKERLGGSILKIITIPAFKQYCQNPLPQIPYPKWLFKQKQIQDDKFKQKGITQFFNKQAGDMPKKTFSLDIEDIAKAKVGFQDAKPVKEDKYQNIELCPKPQDNFGEWLKFQKSSWRRIRTQMKLKRTVLPTLDTIQQQPVALKNFLAQHDSQVLSSTWHVVQVQESGTPGVLKVWAAIKSPQDKLCQMFEVKLKVNRTVFINSKIESNKPEFKRVTNKVLPRARPAHHLYEWTVSEEEYKAKFHKIESMYLVNQNIEGVYESKTPLRFRALQQLSCLLRPKKSQISVSEMALSREYTLDELEAIPSRNDDPYLPDGSFLLNQVYHVAGPSGHHMFMLQIEETKQFHFIEVHPKRKKASPELDTVKMLLRQAFESANDEDLELQYKEWIVESEHTFSNISLAVKQLDKIVKEASSFRQLKAGQSNLRPATFMILHSQDMSVQKFRELGGAFSSKEFPMLRCKFVLSEDIDILQFVKSSIQNIVFQMVYQQYWLQMRRNFSQYGLVPLANQDNNSSGNLLPDGVIDIIYSRALKQSRHVLWYSDDGKPDLGGHEKDDFRSYFQDELSNPEICKQGFYRGGYTIEVNISELILSTVLNASEIQGFEHIAKKDEKVTFQGEQKQKKEDVKKHSDLNMEFDEFNTCASAFQILKDLVQYWYKDRQTSDVADHICRQFQKWLQSPNKLYDPLLHRLVHKLQAGLFRSLLDRLKTLDCNVIFQSFHKLLIFTGKPNLEQAESHVQFAINTLKNEKKFRTLNIQTGEAYRILLFKDAHNFAGIKESDPLQVHQELDIALHLPLAVRNIFTRFVSDFVTEVYVYNKKILKHNKKKEEEEAEEQEMVQEKLTDTEFISDIISKKYSQKLFQCVSDFLQHKVEEIVNVSDDEEDVSDDQIEDDMREDYWEEDQDQLAQPKRGKAEANYHIEMRKKRERERIQTEKMRWDFPDRIGSHHDYTSPALEFSKMITTHIFGIDKTFEQESGQVKANLLRLIHVKEFSNEAQGGLEPSLKLVVPDVICESCHHCFDLDICRDQSLNQESEAGAGGRLYGEASAASHTWLCPECNMDLNKLEVERRLLELVNRRMISYQLQDLTCKNCNMVKNTMVAGLCECTGQYKQTRGNVRPEKLLNSNLLNDYVDVKLFMQLMRNFSNFHGMAVLKSMTEQSLQLFA